MSNDISMIRVDVYGSNQKRISWETPAGRESIFVDGTDLELEAALGAIRRWIVANSANEKPRAA